MLAQFKALLNQTITVKAEASRDASGDPAFGSATTISAYVEKVRKVVELATGEKVETSHWIATETEILLTDRVWLPGATTSDDDQSHTVASVEAFVDENGTVHHYETTVF